MKTSYQIEKINTQYRLSTALDGKEVSAVLLDTLEEVKNTIELDMLWAL